MKRYYFIFIGIIIAAALFYHYFRHPLSTQVIIRGHAFSVDLAITDKEIEKGLGGRNGLAENAGMLFVFRRHDRYSFWMKDMKFPIDIIWIEDNEIVDITKNATVDSYREKKTFTPSGEVNKVLEITAGLSDQYGFQEGDLVQIHN